MEALAVRRLARCRLVAPPTITTTTIFLREGREHGSSSLPQSKTPVDDVDAAEAYQEKQAVGF